MPRRLEEFSQMCYYRVCSRAIPDGRITLSEMKLITTRNGRRDELLLKSHEEWRVALRDHFGNATS
jgi:N-hydroxyarylamine O-acetyltransferase